MTTFVLKNLRRLFDKYAVARTEHDALVKSTTKIFSNFVAFSENPNFKKFLLKTGQKLVFRIWNLLNISIIKPTFVIGNWKKIKFFKTSLNNKNSISFSHIKLLLTLIFAPKMMELWSFFLSCFWGPLKLLRPLKKAQILDSWH